MKSFPPLAALLLVPLGAMRAAEPAPEHLAFFENKIRPVLAERCYECHSAGKKQKGNLLLDTREGALKGGDTGPAIVPGDVAKSLLITAIKRADNDTAMPPKGKGEPLTPEQVADFEQGVKIGAPDPRTGARTLARIDQLIEDAKKHWAFLPLGKTGLLKK